MFSRPVAVMTLIVMVSACQSPGEPREGAGAFPPTGSLQGDGGAFASAAYEIIPTYRIGVDDLLLVSVWGNEQLTVQVPVRPDGRISVPLVGDVRAGGKTPEEVSRVIEKQLDDYVRDPKVSVILVELRSHAFISRVRVTGAVRQPMSVPYRQGITVLDLVLLAGGLNDFAAPGRAKLYRRLPGSSGSPEVRDIELDDILLRGDLETNHQLLPGDVLTVPERIF